MGVVYYNYYVFIVIMKLSDLKETILLLPTTDREYIEGHNRLTLDSRYLTYM